MNLTTTLGHIIMPWMTRYTLPLALLGLMLLTPSCRYLRSTGEQRPYYTQEEAEPVSNLPHDEFSQVTPQRRRR